MRSILKRAARLVPPIRQLHEARDSLLVERDGLLQERDRVTSERDSLLVERDGLLQGQDGFRSERDSLLKERDQLRAEQARVSADLAPILIARAEARLILTDYPYHPDSRDLAASSAGQRLLRQLRAGEDDYAALLQSFARLTGDQLARIARSETPDAPAEPFWDNAWFPPFDAASLCGLLARFRPRRYVEVGSGNSTRFARRAIRDLGLETRIVSIDPHPRAEIDAICDEVVRQPLERVDMAFWQDFGPDDMLFVDNSHRSFTNSDVTVFFTDILPSLPVGAIWGLHDIFLPGDYPDFWRDRFYNEQYLLLAYLEGGARNDDILLPVAWVASQPGLHDRLGSLWKHGDLFTGIPTVGGAFWMRRSAGA